MGMKSYGGRPSDWIGNGMPRWVIFLTKLIGPGHNVLSVNYREDKESTRRYKLPWDQRCLPGNSLSTAGFISMLLRWCSVNQDAGGTAEGTGPRDVALSLVTTLLDFAQSGAPIHVAVQVLKTRNVCTIDLILSWRAARSLLLLLALVRAILVLWLPAGAGSRT